MLLWLLSRKKQVFQENMKYLVSRVWETCFVKFIKCFRIFLALLVLVLFQTICFVRWENLIAYTKFKKCKFLSNLEALMHKFHVSNSSEQSLDCNICHNFFQLFSLIPFQYTSKNYSSRFFLVFFITLWIFWVLILLSFL